MRTFVSPISRDAQYAMFEQAFKNIDDILHKDAGASCELHQAFSGNL